MKVFIVIDSFVVKLFFERTKVIKREIKGDKQPDNLSFLTTINVFLHMNAQYVFTILAGNYFVASWKAGGIWFCGRPCRKAFTLAMAMLTSRVRASLVAHAICGVM